MFTKSSKNRFSSGVAGALLVLTAGWSAPAQAALDISDVPLYLTANVEPNIMLTFDDSGSMQWDIMPDLYTAFGRNPGESYYVYPFPSGLYGATDYGNFVPTFTDNMYNALTRSPQVNSVYYNPAITYLPWKKSDNTDFPNADPAAAFHNPVKTSLGSRNLQTTNTQTANWGSCTAEGTCSSTSESRTFWPAVYFYKTGDAVWNWGSYEKVEIRPGTTSYAGHGRESRTDCVAGVCTYAQEIQNFANWYTYYRSRAFTARAGIGRAFAQQGEAMRVGFATLNASPRIVREVRSFTGSERVEFFEKLYGQKIPEQGTPLRETLIEIGTYYSDPSNSGPWGNTPGSDDSTPHAECRQSYNILMTDGYWSASSLRVGNVDKTSGEAISDPDGGSYTYSPANPYQDDHSNTLADVAMKYWNTDLRDDLANRVPTNSKDPAFWQHLVNFTVGLGVSGSLDPTSTRADIDAARNPGWPNPTTADAHKLDDLWHAAVNSRGDYFSASNPDAFATALSDTLAAIEARVESSASSVAANSTRLDTETLIYQARFDSTDWSGELFAYSLDPDDGTLVTPPAWDAGQLIPAAGMRNIFTYKDSTTKGIIFQWSNLNATQQAQLNKDIDGTVDALGPNRVAWLRGDSSNEQRFGGSFRNRLQSVLGDIINSDPFYVARQDFGYSVLPSTEGTSYTAFRGSSSYGSRPDMLYVGANDGMLHGFNANTGVEVFAYVPGSIYSKLSHLTSPDYDHKYYVDGSPRVGDAYINLGSGAQWRSVLVGSTGAGGRSVFALDVTSPSSFGTGNVLWELSHSELGYSIGQPTIARLKADDRWVAIFGNGYNSSSHTARLFIVDLASGAVRKVIDTGVGSAANPNGLATPVPVDIDGDRITDAVYAGDLHGNLWKFDLSGSNETSWDIAYRSGSTPIPLYKATDSDGTGQPVTVRPTVGRHPQGGVMVYFGTGKYFEVDDGVVPETPQIQSFYGIRDSGSAVSSRSNLQGQEIQFEGEVTFDSVTANVRAVSNNTVDYATKKGWYLDLVYSDDAKAERVVSSAILRHGRIIFTTLIPSSDPCESGGSSWLMEMDALSGARLDYTVLDLNEDGEFNSEEYVTVTLEDDTEVRVPVSGNESKVGIIRTPGVVSAGDREYKYTSGSSGGVGRHVEKGDPDAGRQSWRQLR